MTDNQNSAGSIDDELSSLGIRALDQSTLEKNVQKKVDAVLAEHEKTQQLNILRREFKEVSNDITSGQKKALALQNKLEGHRIRITDPRKLSTTIEEIDECNENITALEKRLKDINEELDETTEHDKLADNLEEGEIVDDENELEKLVRLGEVTPFASLKSNRRNDNISLPSTSTNSDERFLNQTSQPNKKRKIELKSNNLTQQSNIRLKDSSMTVPTGGILKKYLLDQRAKQNQYEQSVVTKNKSTKSSKDSLYSLIDQKKNTNNKRQYPPPKWKDNDYKMKSNKKILSNVSKSQLSKLSKGTPLKKSLLKPKKNITVRVGSIMSDKEVDRNKITPSKILSECVAFEGASESENEDRISDEGSEYLPSDQEKADFSDYEPDQKINSSQLKIGKKKSTTNKSVDKEVKVQRQKDDSNQKNYQKRLEQHKKQKLKRKLERIENEEDYDDKGEMEFEQLDYGIKVPQIIWQKLFKYQKTGVKWMWELHSKGCGGILGDEMGLGKTVEVIAFLTGLRCWGDNKSWRRGRGLGPVLIICPATILHQWLKHFHDWWAPFRVAVLHSSTGYDGNLETLLHNICKDYGVVITSYTGARDNIESINKFNWHYVILDEGHKIRNPEALITLAVKKINTPHRLILSGSPIQNSLKELWSLFDFVFPGKLGTLAVFMQQFSVPITQGGYANASRVEVETGYKCAVVLRDTIKPYLLRRMKADVKSHLTLPDKSEQVLFCALTDEQRQIYKSYIDGDQVSGIMKGRLKVFVGLINLRKICNHPDLYSGGTRLGPGETVEDLARRDTYGWWEKSGKMQVVEGVLKLWSKQGHRVLLFTQSAQMLVILENFLIQQNYTYLKMTGKTAVGGRQSLVQKFNTDLSVFVFLLTTRVGGLGVNLTGADRVIIYDPDWNPSTDIQARERAWRIGQLRNVTIYRLLTAGTIEEKIYHRQIFKQFLTNRVLKDPKQQRFFKTNDLNELFTLQEGEKEKNESSVLFAGLGSDINVDKKRNNKTEVNDNKGTSSRKNSSSKIILVNNSKMEDTDSKLKTILTRKNNGIGIKSTQSVPKSLAFNSFKIPKAYDSTKLIKNSASAIETVDDSSFNIKISEDLTSEYGSNFELDSNIQESSSVNDYSKLIGFSDSTTIVTSESLIETQPTINQLDSSDKINEKNTSDVQKSEADIKEEKMRALAKLLNKKLFGKKDEKDDIIQDKYIKFKKKKKGKKFEGTRVPYLVKKRVFKQSEEEMQAKQNEDKMQDEYVLSKLFKHSGVHTALSHDVIVGAKDSDYYLLESEAERVAKDALKIVRQSRSQCFKPTLGNSSSKKNKKLFGNENSISSGPSTSRLASSNKYNFNSINEEDDMLSSSQLLLKIKSRQQFDSQIDEEDGQESDIDDTVPQDDPEVTYNVDLLEDIQHFVAFQAAFDGRATTNEIISRFNDRLPKEKTHIFKAMLKKICEFRKDGEDVGWWYIKQEFR